METPREGGDTDMSHDYEYAEWDAIEGSASDVCELARTSDRR